MSLFAQLNSAAAKHGLRFIVIGGHAVIQHGHQRGTEDADILVNKKDRALWQRIAEGLGYKLHHVKSMATWNCMNESSASSLNEPAPACAGPAKSGDHLELPDWSGQRPRQRRVPTDEWLAYCRSNLPLIRSQPGNRERRRKSKVSVEFVL